MTPARLTEFERCPRLLWLTRFRPGAAELAGADGEARLATAQAVKAEAQRQCAGAVTIDYAGGWTAAVAATRQAVAGRRAVLNAAFERDGLCATVDIATPVADGWQVIAVRGATRAKPHHLAAVATQRWVAEGAGLSVAKATVRHLDRDFILPADGYLSDVFADSDVTASSVTIAAGRAALLDAAQAILAGAEPPPATGDHCRSPHPCIFTAHCHATLPPGPDWPVTILPRGAGKRFAEQGMDDLTLIPAEALRSDTDRRIWRASITGAAEHDPAGVAAATRDWSYPRIWLDFETVAHALPAWPGARPYEQVPFQFVADVETADGHVERHEFLSLDGADPRRACADALAALPAQGAVIAWHAVFERGVIDRLASRFPDLAGALYSLADRIVDLLPVARDHWYHRDQRGSWSIKAVLPTIAPELDYAMLEVKAGGDAVEAYLEASAPDCTPDRRIALDRALRVYCGRDVDAMRVIYTRLIDRA
ncbi:MULTISPECIES: DUF2779 domain-containing protein [unclassified Sphingomonas]|uniref:DUF2779 domain-containing protein n=1 Tax=unclassified Sphingomonas TaxID=196159 RepID=UPI001910A882|nr:DUF2779 domain-containing protein [Sphingomonas sp. Leaf10]